jgi:hypothetical protein
MEKCRRVGMKIDAVQNERDRISTRKPSQEEQTGVCNGTIINMKSLMYTQTRF